MILPDILSTGPYKLGGGSRFDNIRQLELVKESFVKTVVHEREQSPYRALQIDGRTLGEGHIYLGSEALALGLVDSLGGVSDAIPDAAGLAGVTSYEVRDLEEYLGLPFQPADPYMAGPSLVQGGLAGRVLMLDSRLTYLASISLTGDRKPGQGSPAISGRSFPADLFPGASTNGGQP